MAKKTKNLFTLMQPVVRKDSEIGQVEITGAISQAGSLRGLNLIRVANMDADSIATLLTRVTAPALTQKEINEMHTLDFIGLAELLVPFLNPPEPGASNVAETESVERGGDGERVITVAFDQIDDLVADIAVIFNWPPSEVFGMDLGEVIAWRKRAALRSGASDEES